MLGQFAIDQNRNMIERLYEQNYVSLVKILLIVKDKIDEITAN